MSDMMSLERCSVLQLRFFPDFIKGRAQNKFNKSKSVLVRDCKRRLPSWFLALGGTPILARGERYPYPGQGYPYLGWVSPGRDLGAESGVLPQEDLGPDHKMGQSPPMDRQTDACENITFPLHYMSWY